MPHLEGNFQRRSSKCTIAGLLTLCFAQTLNAQVVPVPSTVQVVRSETQKPRNVVFILSDDHRYDAMSFMGHPLAKTPHMDEMAKKGVHLKNAFVTTSLCSPSRASILTGLYTFRHRVIDNQRPVPEGTLFFPQYLQQAGYTTGFIGKWHMGHANDDPRPGFDYWFSFKGQGQYYPPGPRYTINDNGKRVPWAWHYGRFPVQHSPGARPLHRTACTEPLTAALSKLLLQHNRSYHSQDSCL